jgi:hypothetical protein
MVTARPLAATKSEALILETKNLIPKGQALETQNQNLKLKTTGKINKTPKRAWGLTENDITFLYGLLSMF